MEFLYNSYGASLKICTLDGICTKIVDNNHDITDDDIRILYQLFGQLLLKAIELIDKEQIELITILNSERSYFSVQGSTGFYTIYPRINFCPCFMYKMTVMKKEKTVMCKHILAAHLALALNKFTRRNATNIAYCY